MGGPKSPSTSFMIWTEDYQINPGKITIVGSDLDEVDSFNVPFAQISVLKGHFEDEYETYQRLRRIQRKPKLEGYMLKTMPRKIWSRVSEKALENGFSLIHLGKSMIDKFSAENYVDSAEMIFVTSSEKDVGELMDISKRVERIIGAMNKMVEETLLDCEDCEYFDVCSDVVELRRIRKELKESG